MSTTSVSNLERGEYQHVTNDSPLPIAPLPGQRWWRRPIFVIGLAMGLMVIAFGMLVVLNRGDASDAITTSRLHKTEVKASIDGSGTSDDEDDSEHAEGSKDNDDEIAAAENASTSTSVTVSTATTTATSVTTTTTATTATTAATTSTITTTTTTTTSATTTTSDLRPDEHRHDGNSCEDNEENFLGLCYKTCKELTDGVYPVRSSPFHCCKDKDCLSHEQVRSWIPCQGYDVDGTDECPHAPGACLVDEESHAGLCYKKCSILTNDTYPHRVAAETCCKGEGLECLDFVAEDVTNKAFAVGGGRGDSDSSTPGKVHGPLDKLTEGHSLISPALDALNATGHNQKPHERRNDGNQCEDNEELLAGLCYKTCSSLTNGEYPVRSSAFTCCKTRACFLQQKMGGDMPIPCQGYDVNGHGSCPHAPGACLKDEELFLGLCYAKCALLTSGQYPYRVAPLTCCKENDEEKCLDPFYKNQNYLSDTSTAYEIAGGGGDKDTKTPGHVHAPLQFLTEAM